MSHGRFQWLAVCIVAGLLGCMPFFIGGVFKDIEIATSVISLVFATVVVPALLSAPRLSSAKNGRQQGAELPWRPFARASVVCSVLTFGMGFVFDHIMPDRYWIDGVGIAISVSILLFATMLATRGFRTQLSCQLVVSGTASITVVYMLWQASQLIVAS